MNTIAHRRSGALDTSRQMLSRAAHWHADQGLFVFPLAPGRKVPAVEKDWEHQATTDHLDIARTWRQAPYNLLTGLRDDTPLWIGGPGELGL